MRMISLLLAFTVLSACATGERQPMGGDAATLVDPMALAAASSHDRSYEIGPGDLLRVTVFQVPDLSVEAARVDASGNIQLPLVGSVTAAGSTPADLAASIADRLRTRFLQNPQVSVAVTTAASAKVTVDGAVLLPGVYEMQGRTSLIGAVAMANGATRTADLTSVAVFRIVDGQRMVGVFDLAAIRRGQAADPILHGEDVVVVDTSRLSSLYRDALTALPAIAVFNSF